MSPYLENTPTASNQLANFEVLCCLLLSSINGMQRKYGNLNRAVNCSQFSMKFNWAVVKRISSMGLLECISSMGLL